MDPRAVALGAMAILVMIIAVNMGKTILKTTFGIIAGMDAGPIGLILMLIIGYHYLTLRYKLS